MRVRIGGKDTPKTSFLPRRARGQRRLIRRRHRQLKLDPA